MIFGHPSDYPTRTCGERSRTIVILRERSESKDLSSNLPTCKRSSNFQSLTNCPSLDANFAHVQSLSVQSITNCPFCKSFVLTFIQNAGGCGGSPRAGLKVLLEVRQAALWLRWGLRQRLRLRRRGLQLRLRRWRLGDCRTGGTAGADITARENRAG